MKKWESPKVKGIGLKETETLGSTSVICFHTRSSSSTPITCWQCNCCKYIYHAKDSSESASQDAKSEADACYAKDIAIGKQCLS